ncbi:FAD/NAD(P)-binding protein [Pararhodonellum marinum]|uniref:FAD/NAD(P)-binding protein n=1 Tax=Pararhodonellum marinum TaxID=2755358 RepID=UPI00188E6082|nr:FAD/NAD(P)-binding protein [Pararhodonellum marinum]
MKNITIIGGGACGVAAFLELFIQITSQKITDQVKITLIEKSKPFGYGLAFGTDQKGHLLNTQAELMGIFASEPGHFSQWLKKNGGKKRKDVKGKGKTDRSYTTRELYGDYIASQFEIFCKRAKAVGLQLDLLEAEVNSILKKGTKYQIKGENLSLESDFVVMALGTPKPNNYPELYGKLGFVDFPYPADHILEEIGSKDHVGILGSSLSAIDTIMTLVDNGHNGKISLFSPDGLLPRVQPIKPKSVIRKKLTIEAIHQLQRKTLERPKTKDLFRLYRKEVEKLEKQTINWKKQNRMGKDPAKLLEKDIQIAENGGDAMMQVAYSLRHDTATIWNWMSMEEKLRFKKWLGPHWAINRHGMPLPNARRLKKLFGKGKLEVIPFLEKVNFDEETSVFSLQTKDSHTYQVSKLINATGAASQLKDMHSPLVETMVKNKLLTPYPMGGAIINARTMEVQAEKAGNGIYAIGHLVNGVLMDVNAVWYNVKTIESMSHDIILKIRNGDFY